MINVNLMQNDPSSVGVCLDVYICVFFFSPTKPKMIIDARANEPR